MSGFDAENFPEGEWDDKGDLAWNEFDWQQYLKQNEHEIARFLGHYNRLKQQPGRLDEIAILMGWDREDWSPPESDDDTPNPWDALEDESLGRDEEEIDRDDLDPYTIHRHPVFIVTRALYRHLGEAWEFMLMNESKPLANALSWKFAASMHAGELNAVMALQSLDMGDFNLAICHFKNALAALNHTLALVNEMPSGNPKLARLFQSDARIILFDLRELWLRAMLECREENRRRWRGE